MLKYFNNIAIVTVVLLGLGVGECYATVVYDTNGDVVTDSSNIPVSDTNGTALAAPSITTQPVDATVNVSAPATFTLAASGNPMPTYQWLQEAPGASSFTPIIGATSASYTTSPTTNADSSTEYKCIVKSVLGKIASNVVTLFVDAAPTIITQPVSVSVDTPVTATFVVVAAGIPAPFYQWQSEGPATNTFTIIPGATSASYTTPATTTANNGTKYDCVISNSIGGVTTNVVTLKVNPATFLPPTLTTQPVNATVLASTTATFTVAATG